MTDIHLLKTNDTLLKRLKALTAYRVLFVTVLLGSFFVFQIGYRTFYFSSHVLDLIVVLYLLSIAYSVTLMLGKATPLLAYIQLGIDIVAAMLLIMMTGGIESWFSFVLLLIVIASAIILGDRAGYALAIFASLLYGLFIDLQYYQIVPVPYDSQLTERDFLYNIFSRLLALYLTAYLLGYLTSSLESTATRLEKTGTDLEELTLFNRDVIESMPSGLITTHLDGRIMLFNRAAEEIMGVERGGVEGRRILELFPFVASLSEGGRYEGVVTADDKVKILGLSISRMLNPAGQEKGYICIFEDLTDIKKMQLEIKRKEKWALIGELSANMAHEIRNPLASMKNSFEMLREGTLPEPQRPRLMEIAIREMDRLNVIITEFLNYSRPKPLNKKRIKLNALLAETLELLGDRRNIEVNFEPGGGVDGQGDIELEADWQKLRQVFWNLGLNALQSIEEKGGGGRLRIRTFRRGGQAVIVFDDTGTGIDQEMAERIFYPFYTTKSEGTGLGLSIAYRIVHDHGGSLEVSPKEDEEGGSVFTVILPESND